MAGELLKLSVDHYTGSHLASSASLGPHQQQQQLSNSPATHPAYITVCAQARVFHRHNNPPGYFRTHTPPPPPAQPPTLPQSTLTPPPAPRQPTPTLISPPILPCVS
jgi:hypothetical protein